MFIYILLKTNYERLKLKTLVLIVEKNSYLGKLKINMHLVYSLNV